MPGPPRRFRGRTLSARQRGQTVGARPACPTEANGGASRPGVLARRRHGPLLPGLRFTAPFNLTGQPALSVPVGRGANGLPLGVQLVGRPFADGTVLAVGERLQTAMAGQVGAVPIA